MEKGCSSKAANLKFQLSASNGDEDMQKNKQPISKFNLPASDHDNEVPEFPLANNGPNLSLSGSLLAEYTAKELAASRMQKASQKAKSVSSPAGTTDEPLLQHERSNEKPMQPTCPGIGGSVSSGGDARAAQQATSFTPLIAEPTQSFSLALQAENIPQNRSSATQSSHSKHLGNSGPANSLNSQTGKSLRAELQRAQQFSYQNNQLPWALGLYNSQTGSTVFHEIFIPLSSVLLPAQDPQASNLLSIMPNLPNQDHHNSELSWPVAVHQRGFLNQTTKPTATYPSSGTSMSSLLLNSSLLHETVGSSAPNLMQTQLSNHSEQGTSEPGGNARSRLEVGESSPFKRLRGETNEPQAPSAEQIMGNSLSLPTGATASPDIGNLLPPRPIMNSLYDPKFEELGLPIDPHLRLFAKYKK
ncbi:hypothetical protein ES319_A05G238500v1 [Gossypium barbadense]|uniref:Uncharacterized protein n=1 Tax=Gossypium barbadense TaxID=3634 RepID=A0A5J5VS83_GOSBA|nr:hypothetical protein ES319_A05G238500v1 [Gossypium barbadense]